MLNIDDLRNLCFDENIAVSKHARKRLFEREITIDDIKNVIFSGEIIRLYEDDKPFPSCLVLGKAKNNCYIHVVASIDNDDLHIITAYQPDESVWEADFKSKRKV